MSDPTMTGPSIREVALRPGASSYSPSGEVIVRKQNTGWTLLDFPVHVYQATDDASYYIRCQDNDDCPWSLYVAATAGDVVVLRGRWHSVRVVLDNAATLYVRGDAGFTAWG